MSVEKHIKYLKQGRDAWNVWRAENGSLIPDLSGEDLSGSNLQGYNFENCLLGKVNFKGSDLSFSNLKGVDIYSFDLTEAVTDKAVFDVYDIDLSKHDSANVNIENYSVQDKRKIDVVSDVKINSKKLKITKVTSKYSMHSDNKIIIDDENNLQKGSIVFTEYSDYQNSNKFLDIFDGNINKSSKKMNEDGCYKRPEKSSVVVGFSYKSDNCIPVLFGTNRKPFLDSDEKISGYSTIRDVKINYGICNVYVPHDRKMGEVKQSLLKKIINGILINNDIGVDSYLGLTSKKFTHLLDSQSNEKSEVLIYIHGYNVDFKEAAIRAAQLGVDLCINGLVTFFSWPSKGEIKQYMSDEATIQASEYFFEDYLKQLVGSVRTNNVYIVAHSMGNRGLLSVLKNMQLTNCNIKFKHIVLAAPDVDKDVFERDSSCFKYCSEHTTLYVSDKDRTVSLSKYIHDYDRVGYVEPISICDGIQTIKVSNIDVGLLGHGYYAEARSVVSDINDALRGNHPRVQLDKSRDGREYWDVKR